MTYFTLYCSPIGPLVLTSDGTALTGLTFGEPEPQWKNMDNLSIFNSARSWLDAYFTRKSLPVDFPLSPAGTAFQRRVWDLLAQIPYGKTTTYGQIAKRLGENMSAQAVGQAVGRNPIAIVLPCHRCVGAKGRLTGYAWGMDKKKWLLRHEEESK